MVRATDKIPAQETGHLVAQPAHEEDIISWLQLLRAIEDAEAGHGTARLAEICLSAYGALAAAQFQITQLRARVQALAASRSACIAVP
jgi:hypothetical protein